MFRNGAEIFEDTFLNQIQFIIKILNNFKRSCINFTFPKKFREIIDAQRHVSCDFTENLAPLCVFSSILNGKFTLAKSFHLWNMCEMGVCPPKILRSSYTFCKNLIKIWKIQARGKKLLNGAVSYKRKLQIWSFLAFFDVKGAFIRMMNAQKIHPYVISS